MKYRLLLLTILMGLVTSTFSQNTLPEIIVIAVRYKYLSAVTKQEVSQPVKMLQRQAAEYNVKSTDYYEEDNDVYFVSFYIPEGQILASYDKDGKLLSTVEKYKDIELPKAIGEAVGKRFPNWSISKDVYFVNYHETNTEVKKYYKLTLRNGDRRMQVKVNAEGEFM